MKSKKIWELFFVCWGLLLQRRTAENTALTNNRLPESLELIHDLNSNILSGCERLMINLMKVFSSPVAPAPTTNVITPSNHFI